MRLRDYQVEAVKGTLKELPEPGSATLGVAATGLGKTVMFAHVIKETIGKGRWIVLAHREELVHQAASKIKAVTGITADIEMAERKVDHGLYSPSKVIVASKDSLRNRLDRYDPKKYYGIITDEAHHSPGMSYRAIYDHFKAANPDIRHFGVTATPDRHDEVALRTIFNTVAFDYDVLFGVENGWLCEPRQTPIVDMQVDYSKARTVAGDFNQADLDIILKQQEVVQGMAKPIVDLAKWRSTLIFCVSIAQAETMVKVLKARLNGRAGVAMVSGTTPTQDRADTLKDFAARKIQFLVNVGVFTEGFDEPVVEVIAMCRPTKSRSLYAQMLGRGTRPVPGVVDRLDDPASRINAIAESRKPFLEVIDFVGNSGAHKLVTAVDILGGREDDEVTTLASEIIGRGKATSTREAIEQAKEELAEKERLRLAALAAQAASKPAVIADVQYVVGHSIDPFAAWDMRPRYIPEYARGTPVTDKQRTTLEALGVKPSPTMTRLHASQIIEASIQRRLHGLCTLKQAAKLKQYGIDGKHMTFEEARVELDMIAADGWRRKAVSA